MLCFSTGSFSVRWMLSCAHEAQPGTWPQGFTPSVLPCEGNPSFGICLFFSSEIQPKMEMEKFPHGVKFFGRGKNITAGLLRCSPLNC